MTHNLASIRPRTANPQTVRVRCGRYGRGTGAEAGCPAPAYGSPRRSPRGGRPGPDRRGPCARRDPADRVEVGSRPDAAYRHARGRAPRAPGGHVNLAERVLTVPEAARLLRVGERSVYAAVHRGELPACRIGRRIVLPGAALERF